MAVFLLTLPPTQGQSVTTDPSVPYAAVNCTVLGTTAPRIQEKKLTFGVILPLGGSYFWSLRKTRSAIEYAVETVRDNAALLPGWDVRADFRDSKCSETDGPLEAIEMYTKRTAQVFLGPACDYAVAPIARFTKRWEIPVITAGALVKAFEDKREYRLLTRLMGSYAKAAEVFIEIASTFNWKTVGMLYHDNDGEGVSRSDCYFILETFFFALSNYNGGKEPWYEDFDEKQNGTDFEYLLKEASLHTRSKPKNP
nr:hypothetical protein BaRGS_016621 [Batillaria attramentaria]